MKCTVFSYLLLFISLYLLAGCAQSKLKMELSIYKDDPLYKNVLLQSDIEPSKVFLDDIDNELGAVVTRQMEIADASYDLFKSYWMAQGEVHAARTGKKDKFDEAKHSEALIPLREQLNNYKRSLNQKGNRVQHWIDLANSTYFSLYSRLPSDLELIDFTQSSYLGQLQQQQRLQQKLNIQMTRVYQSLDAILRDSDDPFLESTKARWRYIEALIFSQDYENHLEPERVNDLKDRFSEVVYKIKDSDSKVIEITSRIKDGLDDYIEHNRPLAFINSMMDNPTVYKVSAEEESKMMQAVDLLNSQLDRFQDSSSPVWRIVTDPQNAKKWNTEFSKTYFYAEGNAGVVVVRDSPIKYRVQDASNNPAALVQAQLGVSRAVADAAIQIAGATTGVPLLSVTQAENKTLRTDNSNYGQQTETLTAKKAELKAQKQIFQRSFDAIEGNIDSYIRQLKELTPKSGGNRNDQDKINDLADLITQYLKAQESLVLITDLEPEGN